MLNEIACYDILDQPQTLVDLLENNSSVFEDDNSEPNIYQQSPYYSNFDLPDVLFSKRNSFNLLSLNCQSLQAKFESLKCYIKYLKDNLCVISAICLQETWLASDSDLSLLQLEDYNLISKGKSCSTHGGVAIYLHTSFKFEILGHHTETVSCDAQFLEISLNSDLVSPVIDGQKLIIGNFYRPPRQLVEDLNNFQDELNVIMENIQCHSHVVITGDFNIDLLRYKDHLHTSDFLDNLLSNGYIPKITMPTRLTHRKGTLIDKFFIELSMGYSNTTSGILISNISDHLPYFLSLDYLFIKEPIKKRIKVVHESRDSISNFKHALLEPTIVEKLNNLMDTDINTSYNKFDDILNLLINKHFPIKYKRNNKYKNKKNDWITSGILRSIAFRDKLYQKLKSTKVDNPRFVVLKNNLKTYNRILKQSIRLAKKSFYSKYFNDYKNNIKKTWNMINEIINKKKFSNSFPKQFLINDNLESDPKTIAQQFNNYFVEIGPKLASSIKNNDHGTYKDYLNNPIQQTFLFNSINKSEIIKTIDNLKPKTSYGIDRLSNKLLKQCKQELAYPIMLLFNKSVQTCVFPNKLKIARVLPIFKKNENFKFENYRPISILPSVSKVFEKIMHTQISEYFMKSKLFYQSQYGFRTCHSTEYAVLEVVERIITTMDKNLIPLNIYLDLSKAFDTLDHEILLYKLKYYGFHSEALDFMKSYLLNRKQYVEFEDVSSDLMPLTVGVPQGSILGPLLFIIYINDLVYATAQFHPVIYADDSTLMATLNSFGETDLEANVNSELVKISNWLNLNKLSLNTAKTKAMVFHTAQREVCKPHLKIENHTIEFVDSFNLLGIVIDSKLKWGHHIDNISKKISRTSGIINKLKNFIPLNAILDIYNSLILSYINYGLLIWSGKGNKVSKLQKKAIRYMTRSKHNAHTSGLFKALNLLKYDDLCVLHDYKFIYRAENGKLPIYFMSLIHSLKNPSQNYTTRQNFKYSQPLIKHEFAKHSITYRYPKQFNTMSLNIKEKISTHSFDGFKKYIKTITISSYSDHCSLPTCFVCGRNG